MPIKEVFFPWYKYVGVQTGILVMKEGVSDYIRSTKGKKYKCTQTCTLGTSKYSGCSVL